MDFHWEFCPLSIFGVSFTSATFGGETWVIFDFVLLLLSIYDVVNEGINRSWSLRIHSLILFAHNADTRLLTLILNLIRLLNLLFMTLETTFFGNDWAEGGVLWRFQFNRIFNLFSTHVGQLSWLGACNVNYLLLGHWDVSVISICLRALDSAFESIFRFDTRISVVIFSSKLEGFTGKAQLKIATSSGWCCTFGNSGYWCRFHNYLIFLNFIF